MSHSFRSTTRPKSRYGCAACKARKIKCDETRPTCRKCLLSRRICPGYGQVLKWSGKHEVFASASGSSDQLRRDAQKFDGREKNPAPPAAEQRSVGSTFAHGPEDHDPFNSSLLGLDKAADFMLTDLDLDLDLDLGDFNFELYTGMRSSSLSPKVAGDLATAESCSEIEVANSMAAQNSLDSVQRSMSNCAALALPASLKHQESVLMEYYFASVATLYSCFDGNLNPFRSMVASLRSSSSIMTLTIQSMAAACLSRDFPNLGHQGKQLRLDALEQIEQELKNGLCSDATLLGLIMLGHSAGWHSPQDLGLQQYQRVQQVQWTMSEQASKLCGPNTVSGDDNTFFFRQLLTYWKMILSFVLKINDHETPHVENAFTTDLALPTIPHPWTLASPELMRTISQVGSLLYMNRRNRHHHRFWRRSSELEAQKTIALCQQLEYTLFNNKLPEEAVVVDPGDPTTPLSHLIDVTNAYRLTALVQIYRVFPDILHDRLISGNVVSILQNDSLNPLPEVKPVTEAMAEHWLHQLSYRIIQLLEQIPFESHTRSIQSFLYLALSSEFSVRQTGHINQHIIESIQARALIRSRLEAYQSLMPFKPASRKLAIVKEVWHRLDNANLPVFWMDVMIEQGLEVIFC